MLTGDFKKLAALGQLLGATPELKRLASSKVAEAFEEQLEYQYATGTDPNNEGWAELAESTLARGRKPPPLSDSKEMRRNSKAVAGLSGIAGIRVTVDKPSKPDVPLFHQEGTENMPDRQILPEPGKPLPVAWAAAAERGVGEALVEHFKGFT